MPAEMMQAPVIVFALMMVSFGVVMLFATINDAAHR